MAEPSDLVFRSQAIIQQESGILEARVVCSEISEAAGGGTPLVLGIEHISIWTVRINGDIVIVAILRLN